MNQQTILLTLVFIVVGGTVARVYCELVRRSVAGITTEGTRMIHFLALMIVRVVLVAATFIAAAYLGVWPLIGNIVGFFIVRSVMVSRSQIADTARDEAEKIRKAREERQRNG